MEDDNHYQSSFFSTSTPSSSSSSSNPERQRRSLLSRCSHDSDEFVSSFSPSFSLSTELEAETSSSTKRCLKVEEGANGPKQCQFCEFYFQQLFVIKQFCSVECALGYFKNYGDKYNSYYAWATSCTLPAMQAPYSPKPGVSPAGGESHAEYVKRNIRVLYANARTYEIQAYRKAVFEHSQPLTMEQLSEFEIEHKHKTARTSR